MSEDEVLPEVPLPHADAPSAPPRLLANRQFLWLVLGDGSANLGRWGFYLAVVGDAAFRLQATQTQLAWLLAVFALPLIVASVGYGVLADRGSPKWMLVGATSGAALVPLLALGTGSLPWLFAASAAYGAFHAAIVPGRGAMVPRLVPRDRLVQANGMISAAAAVQLVLGPALSAALVGLLGPRGPYAVAIAAAALSVTCYMLVPDRRREGTPEARRRAEAPARRAERARGVARRQQPGETSSVARRQQPGGASDVARRQQPGGAIGEITAGLREAWRTADLRRLFFIGLAVWFLIGILIPLEPLYLRESLHRGQVFLGIVWTVFGIGETLSSLGMARLREAAGREGRFIGAGLLLGGIGFLLYVSFTVDVAVIAGNVVFGLGFPIFTSSAHGLIQRVARFPGRVSAAFNIIGETGPVLAAVLLATAGDLMSVRGWLLASGALFAGVGLAAFVRGHRAPVLAP